MKLGFGSRSRIASAIEPTSEERIARLAGAFNPSRVASAIEPASTGV